MAGKLEIMVKLGMMWTIRTRLGINGDYFDGYIRLGVRGGGMD